MDAYQDSFVERFRAYLDAGFPTLAIVSAEEARVEFDLLAAAQSSGRLLHYWSVTEGIVSLSDKRREPSLARNPIGALNWAEQAGADNIVILRDFHLFLQSPETLRKIRDLNRLFKTTNQTLVILGARCTLPPELEKEITILEYSLPTRDDLRTLVRRLLDGVRGEDNAGEGALIEEPSETSLERGIEAALGLTAFEAENAFALSLVVKHGIDADLINQEKASAVRKSGVLEVVKATDALDQVGGMALLKNWLRKRQMAFSQRARDFGLPAPRGIILIGVPGSGKSLVAKSVATSWHLPLLRLDMGRVFGSLVGESEQNLRRALALTETVSPVVLWIDEVEKGFCGTASSNRSDAGTAARVFGQFLTWMQEKTNPVFVVATANNVSDLPSEFLRKGRFDEIFFVDLPSEEERTDIFRIHLTRRNRSIDKKHIRALAKLADGYTGAEIEEAVVSALFDAFADGERSIRAEDIAAALEAMTPLSVTMGEQIKALREWAKHRARLAALPNIEIEKQSNGRRLRVNRAKSEI